MFLVLFAERGTFRGIITICFSPSTPSVVSKILLSTNSGRKPNPAKFLLSNPKEKKRTKVRF
jgi:hypothetical protein